MRRPPHLALALAPALLALAFASGVFGASSERTAASVAGPTLAEALEQLRARGLRLIYSSELVEPSMRVATPPRSARPLEAAAELLAPHGLALRRLHEGLYAVVRLDEPRGRTLRGRVIDAAAGSAVAGARIELSEARVIGWSAGDGSFSISRLEPGRQALTVSAEGFERRSLEIDVGHEPEALTVTLAPALPSASEVIVSASRYIYEAAADPVAHTLAADSIRWQPTLGEDALQTIGRVPGVHFSGFSARPNVRGGEASETLILLDGMPIRQAFHMPAYNSLFSVMDEELIRRIDAFTGAFPARYGNRLSGVLDLTSHAPSDAPRRALGLSVFNAHARASGALPDRDLEALASARIGTLGPLLDAFAPDVGRPSYADVFLKSAMEGPAGTRLALHVLGSQDELAFADAESGESAELSSRARYAWLTASRAVGERAGLELLIGATSIDSAREGSVQGDLTADGVLTDSRASRMWDASARLRWAPSDRHAVEAGIDSTWGDARYDYASRAEYDPTAVELFGVSPSIEREEAVRARRATFGVYASDRWRLGERWFLDAGLRVDHERDKFSEDRTMWSPRLALRFDLTGALRLRAGWARMHQSDEVQELQIEDGLTRFQPAQRADHFVLGLEHRSARGSSLRLEGFRKRLSDPRARFENSFDPLRFLPELSPDRIRIAPHASELQGLELSGQWERGHWSLSGAYTLARAVDEQGDAEIPRSWDQRHTASVALAWRRGPWTVTGLALAYSGRPMTPILESEPDAPLLGGYNSARRDAYASLDLRVTREIPVSRGRLVVFAQVTNALGRRNPCCTELGIEDNDAAEPTLEIEPRHGLPRLPALGISWQH